MPNPPDFALAPLRRYRRDLLAPTPDDDQLTTLAKELTLVLGLCFNEIKDLHWALARVGAEVSETPEHVSAINGQLFGMRGTYVRLLSGMMFELAVAVKERSHIARWSPWQQCLERMPRHARDAWMEVTALANRKKGRRPVADYLWKVRDRISHHFDGKVLLSGYAHFFKGSQPGSDALYLSTGNSMEETRFYFADAAAINADKALRESIAWDDVQDFMNQVNLALRFIVEELMAEFERAAEAPTEDGPDRTY